MVFYLKNGKVMHSSVKERARAPRKRFSSLNHQSYLWAEGNSDGQRGSWSSVTVVGVHHHVGSSKDRVSEEKCATETQEAWTITTEWPCEDWHTWILQDVQLLLEAFLQTGNSSLLFFLSHVKDSLDKTLWTPQGFITKTEWAKGGKWEIQWSASVCCCPCQPLCPLLLPKKEVEAFSVWPAQHSTESWWTLLISTYFSVSPFLGADSGWEHRVEKPNRSFLNVQLKNVTHIYHRMTLAWGLKGTSWWYR